MTAGPVLTVARARAWRRRWDAQQAHLVPLREARYDFLIGALKRGVPARGRVLDLGCGTGSLSERILAARPRARVVAVDHDPLLLALGRTALGDQRGRLTWVDADLRADGWDRALPRGSFDAAVSSTALHWLTTDELAALYRVLARRLRRGAIFLNADQLEFEPGARELRRLARAAGREWARRAAPAGESWSAFWRSVTHEPGLRAEAALRRLRYPSAHHAVRTARTSEHLRLLDRAGFREAEVIWGAWRNRILAAVR
ncbi:MAG TPA: class I SAM-dependent methyltransferase [Thermoplasmata archaeon]|nr:class I SAM-dependent methyltransferase [Thermoplasmata archaeon]